MDGSFFISDDYLVSLANRSIIPFANLLLVAAYAFGSLVFAILGVWNFNKLAVGNRSLQPQDRSRYFWGGWAALLVSGFLFSGLSTIDLIARSVVVSEFRALSYSGDKFTGLAEKSGAGFVHGVAYLIGAWLIFMAFSSLYRTTQDRKVSVSRVFTLLIIGGIMIQSKEMTIRAQNTVKTNITGTNSTP